MEMHMGDESLTPHLHSTFKPRRKRANVCWSFAIAASVPIASAATHQIVSTVTVYDELIHPFDYVIYRLFLQSTTTIARAVALRHRSTTPATQALLRILQTSTNCLRQGHQLQLYLPPRPEEDNQHSQSYIPRPQTRKRKTFRTGSKCKCFVILFRLFEFTRFLLLFIYLQCAHQSVCTVVGDTLSAVKRMPIGHGRKMRYFTMLCARSDIYRLQ